MEQLHTSYTALLGSTTGDRFTSLTTARTWTANELDATTPWSLAGYFSDLLIACDTAPGGATAHAFEVLTRPFGASFASPSVPSGLAVNIAGTAKTGENTTNQCAVQPGDLFVLRRRATGSPAASSIRISVKFTSLTRFASGYAGLCGNASNNLANYAGVFCPQGWGIPGTTELVAQAPPVSAPGTIIRFDLFITALPNLNARAFHLAKNSVVDPWPGTAINFGTGPGSTPAQGFATGFALPLAGGDLGIALSMVPGGINTITTGACGLSIAFIASTAGQSNVLSTGSGGPATGAGALNYTSRPGQLGWSGTESTRQGLAGKVDSAFSQLWLMLSQPLGAGTSCTYTVRVNGAAPAGTPKVTLANTVLLLNDPIGAVALPVGGLWTIQAAPLNSPTSRPIAWGLTQFIDPGPDPVPGVHGCATDLPLGPV